MLSLNERHQIIVRLSMINHPSIWGYAIERFNARAVSATDKEILQLVSDLQSQINDNPVAMSEILGEHFQFFDAFHRNEDLNLQNNMKALLQKAVCRYKTRTQQADALGITPPTLLSYLSQYNILTP